MKAKNPISEEDETMMEADENTDGCFSNRRGCRDRCPRSGYRPTMLIVDDDEDMRTSCRAFRPRCIRVLTAEDGKQALRILKKNAM